MVFWDPNSSPCWGRSYIKKKKKVYSGILLGVFLKKLLRLCSFSNSLLRYSVGRSKTAEAVLFFQQFTQVFFWEAKNC